MNNTFYFRTYLICFLLFIFLFSSTSAEYIQKPFLWRIEGQTPSYLFGTIHLPDPRITTLHKSAENAFEQSDVVMTEVALDDKNLFAQVNAFVLSDGTLLSDHVPLDLLDRVEDLLKLINPALTIQPFLQLKAWALAVSLPVLEQQLNNPDAVALDVYLFKRAESEGKQVGGLETVDEQIALLDNMSPEEELKMLRDTVEFMEEAEEKNESIAELFINKYAEGNIEALGRYMMKYVKQDEFYDEFMQKVLFERNHIMTERIINQLENNASKIHFFAIGSGHFWGNTGIQNLLKEKGYKVIRINN